MADTNDKEATLTEEHVIIIACVCGVIIITLLIILFCFIFRRRRNAAKAYQGGNQGDPPPYTAVPPHKKPQVYDNPDGPLDLYPSRSHQHLLPSSSSSSSPKSGVSATLQDVKFEPWSTSLQDHLSQTVLVDKHHLVAYQHNNGVDGYPNRETQGAGSIPQSPSKDKYIGLQDRTGGGGGDPMMGGGVEGGYSTSDLTAGCGKPKKVIYEVVV